MKHNPAFAPGEVERESQGRGWLAHVSAEARHLKPPVGSRDISEPEQRDWNLTRPQTQIRDPAPWQGGEGDVAHPASGGVRACGRQGSSMDGTLCNAAPWSVKACGPSSARVERVCRVRGSIYQRSIVPGPGGWLTVLSNLLLWWTLSKHPCSDHGWNQSRQSAASHTPETT